jgi:predicted PurR-regulated permease PerM
MSPSRSISVRISWLTLLAVTSLAAFAWAFVEVRSVLLVLFLSIFLAAVLNPPVEALARRMRIGRGVASLIVVGAALLLLAVIVTLALSPVIDGVRSLAHDAPKIVQEIRQSSIGKTVDRHSAAPDSTQQQIASFVDGVGKAAGGALGLASSAFGMVVTVFSLIFMTLFLVMDLPKFRRAIGSVLYPAQRERVDRTMEAIIVMTSRYMLGNITISVICGVIYGVTAVILGVPYPLALAVIAGVLDLVPNIGSLIAGIIVAAVSLTVSVGAALAFVIVVLLYQQFENYVLQPTIVGRAADVPGFFVIASVLVFGGLFGVAGAILGVPIFAAVQIIVREVTSGRRQDIARRDAASDGGGAGRTPADAGSLATHAAPEY